MLRARLTRALLAASLAAVASGAPFVAACSGGSRARDVAGDRRPRRLEDAGADGTTTSMVPEPPPVSIRPDAGGKKPRLVTRASARALALDAVNIYYGNSEDDGLYALAKRGGDPVRLARRAPVAGALAVDDDAISWIASPGDAVLKLPTSGGVQPTTLRDRGIFSDVAAASGEVFIAEAVGAGGVLLRVTGPTAARLVSFDGAPRAVMADATHAYLVTPTKIFRTTHAKGELETIATGTAFGNPQIDASFVYAVAEAEGTRAVVRVPKAGGPMTVLARDVRDAPIEVEGADVLFVDGTRSQLRAVPKAGGEARVLLDDEAVAGITALAADSTTIYLAAGARESGIIVATDRQ